MIYIDIEPLADLLPKGWREQAERATEAARQAQPGKARGDLIDRYSRVWRDLKHLLKQLSSDKCWYCESPAHRILGDVDHYRPKKTIDDDEHPHPGYWWLAFHWRNFRFACEICNRLTRDRATGVVRGKGSFFPMGDAASYRLQDEQYRHDDDLLRERPLLLDPTHPADPQLISFDIDGRPLPAIADETSLQHLRAKTSIELYHLDHSALNNWRRDEVYKKVRKYVDIVQRSQQLYECAAADSEVAQGYRAWCKDALSELRGMIAPDAGYSSAARAYLKMYRQADPAGDWVDMVLTAPQSNRRPAHVRPADA